MPTNSRKIYNHAQKLVNYFPCGECFECRRQKTEDLMVRAYFEDCKYVIFDTLTYSEKSVPWLKKLLYNQLHDYKINTINGYEKRELKLTFEDIRVIYYPDFQKFMKRLRKHFNTDEEIKYIVSAEYGNGDYTHRPHFHCIFFCNVNIEPKELSRIIKKCWKFGITDGWQDKGIEYFNNKRVFSGYDSKYNVIGYLCKYVTKDSEYEKIVKDTLKKAMRQIYAQLFNASSSDLEREQVSKIIKSHKQFVKWSKGFGKSFIKNEKNIVDYENKMYLQIRTDLRNKKYSLPLYYKRKIYNVIDKETKEVRLNERGIKLLEKKLLSEYNNNLKRMQLYNDSDISNETLSYYLTYIKDRKDGNLLPDYDKVVALNYNSILDRKTYPLGNVLCNDKICSTEQFIKNSVKNNPEYDQIIEKIIKKESENKSKVSVIKEYNYKIKKNTKKMLYV